MSFKDNLLKKIKINKLTDSIRKTIGPADGTLRLDTGMMAQLLEIGCYPFHKERDLILYRLDGDVDHGRFLVLDNDIAIYETSAADIGLRKSPTVKEMVTFRNIKKMGAAYSAKSPGIFPVKCNPSFITIEKNILSLVKNQGNQR